MTAREVPKATLVDRVGSTPMDVRAQICTGTMMNPPPTPSMPQANPTTIPVSRRTII